MGCQPLGPQDKRHAGLRMVLLHRSHSGPRLGDLPAVLGFGYPPEIRTAQMEAPAVALYSLRKRARGEQRVLGGRVAVGALVTAFQWP